jgi:hypothetical protein
MNAPWKLICLVLALVFFAFGAFFGAWLPAPWPWTNRLIAAGLFFWVLSLVVS